MKQQEYIGFNSINSLDNILTDYNAKNIFIVTSKNSFISSGAKEIIKNKLKNYSADYYSDFSPNIKTDDLNKGIKIFKRKNYDLIIAVGGGSVIDMAKLINIFSCQPEPIDNYLENNAQISVKPIPLIAIPTTSGSGSEATHFAVLYKDKVKFSVAHQYILPEISIIDSDFTMNLPPSITAESGADALCQAVESYWSIYSTDESQKYAKEAIKLIVKSLFGAVNNPTKQDRQDLSTAAHLAGKAINITKTTAAHAISYSFTSYYGLNHGHAVALTLGALLVYNYEVTENDIQDKRGCDFVKKKIMEISDMFGCKTPHECQNVINNLFKSIGIELSLKKLNICDIELIVNNVNTERLINNPRKLSDESLKEILLKL